MQLGTPMFPIYVSSLTPVPLYSDWCKSYLEGIEGGYEKPFLRSVKKVVDLKGIVIPHHPFGFVRHSHPFGFMRHNHPFGFMRQCHPFHKENLECDCSIG